MAAEIGFSIVPKTIDFTPVESVLFNVAPAEIKFNTSIVQVAYTLIPEPRTIQ